MTIHRTTVRPAGPIAAARRKVPPSNWIRRAALIIPDTRDEEARTVDAVIATENPVRVYDYRTGQIMDEVLISRGARMPKWTPMLDSHSRWSLLTLGSAVNYRLQKDVIRATLRFAVGDDVDPIWGRVRDDHLRGVSVGGSRITYTDIEAGQAARVAGRRWIAGDRPLRITTKWQINETSVVVFGADGTIG